MRRYLITFGMMAGSSATIITTRPGIGVSLAYAALFGAATLVTILATEKPTPAGPEPATSRVIETLRACDTCHANEGEPCHNTCPEGIHYGYTREQM